MASTAPQTDASARAQDFLAAFDSFAQAVRRARGTTGQAPEDALTLSQYALLQSLSNRDAARVRELAGEAGITPSTATRILDALDRRGIVRRTRTREDRRGVTITLTSRGQRLLAGQHEWLRGRQLAFYESLPLHERDLAPDLLLRLTELIDELAAGPQGY